MSRVIEIELKFEVLDSDAVAKFVKGLKLIERKRVYDVYFDTSDAGLFKQGIFIRTRNGKKFDIKFNPDHIGKGLDEEMQHTHCDEVSVLLPITPDSMKKINETLEFLGMKPMTSPSVENFIELNGLVESIIFDKQRSSYSDGEFQIEIDNVKDFGEYLEIEKTTDENEDQDKVVVRMKDRLGGLNLRYVDVGYNEIYWRKHNFDLYLQGKYLLSEDKLKYRPGAATVKE